MAYAYVRYNGTGSQTNYTFPFTYLSQDHVKVRVDGVLTSLFSFLNANTIQFFSAPALGAVIDIRRETPKDTPIVNFQDGSVLLERDLDLLATFDLYIAQETADLAGTTLNLDTDGKWDARNYRIKNLANPVNDGDAVNKGTLDYEYPKVSTVADSITSVNIIAADIGGSRIYESDFGSITDLTTTAPTSGSAIVAVADNIATIETIAADLDTVVNAPSYAAAAASSASSAAASASAASTSASDALASKNAAATSVTNAASSATAASTSATNAAASATSASTYKDAAATSATSAASSATSASTSASTASTKATEAATSATNASNSASAAATSATNAASSASSAATSATNAANSATAAANSASSVASSLSNYYDKTASDGRFAPLSHTQDLSTITQSGATTGQVPQWSGTAWVPATVSGGGAAGVSSFNTRTGAVTLTSADVTTALGYTPTNDAGDTMTGKLTLPASTTTSAGLNIGNGSGPTSPVAGDIWGGAGSLTYRGSVATYNVAFLNSAQTFSSSQSFSSTLTATSVIALTGTTNSSTTIGTAATTGTLTLGGTSQTGTIIIGQSAASHTTNIEVGATSTGNTKTINFGTGGAPGSTTNITIGSTNNTTVTANGSWTFSGGLDLGVLP